MRALDLFAGAGGSSQGAELAGLSVVGAVNHWPIAVASHAANHPRSQHWCEDAAVVDPTKLPAHDVLLASPSCTGHTRARGRDLPHHDAARATAWCVLRVAEAHRSRLIVVENVPEFLRWVCYPAWRLALESLGYKLTEQVIDAADAGVPQHRKRLFVVASRGKTQAVSLSPRPHVPAREALDLDAGPWREWRTYARASIERIEAAQKRRGNDCLVPYYSSRSSHAGRSLDEPCGTLTTKDRYVLVRGEFARVLSVQEQLRLQGFPAEYVLHGTRTDRVAQIGNAVAPPVMRAVLEAVA